MTEQEILAEVTALAKLAGLGCSLSLAVHEDGDPAVVTVSWRVKHGPTASLSGPTISGTLAEAHAMIAKESGQ